MLSEGGRWCLSMAHCLLLLLLLLLEEVRDVRSATATMVC